LFALLVTGCGFRYGGPPPEKTPEPAAPAEAPPSSGLREKLQQNRIASSPKRAAVIGRMGGGLTAGLFERRLEAARNTLTFDQIQAQWGPPQELDQDQERIRAVWRWLAPPQQRPETDSDRVEDRTEGDQPPGGRRIILIFDRTQGEVLVDWRMGRWGR
jgi:hypothetical protein